MQHGGDAAPARPKDCGGCDVATGREHGVDLMGSDQAPHGDAGRQQPNQLHQFVEPTALQASGVHGDQVEPCWNQFGFESIRNPQPAHLPVRIKRFCYSQGWKQVAAGATGCDQ
jgi:hypothetical protein